MTIQEAVEKGIDKIRLPKWAFKSDYLKIDIFKNDGEPNSHGPWMHLHSPQTHAATPPGLDPIPEVQHFFWTDDGDDSWEEYKAPAPEAGDK